jgi:hypothetical protein
VLALWKAAKRGDPARAGTAVRANQLTRLGRTGRSPSHVPEVSQVLSFGQQILWILWHSATGKLTPNGAPSGAGATASGLAKARCAATPTPRAAAAFAASGGPARAATASAHRGSASGSAATCGSTSLAG